MFYTHDQGITATKAELAAILQATKDGDERYGHVGFIVDNADLRVQASNGHAAIYHHGDAFDGTGAKHEGSGTWQVSADVLGRIKASMDSKDELILHVNRDGRMTSALVRAMSGDDPRFTKTDLDGYVSEQLAIDLTTRVSDSPAPVETPLPQLGLDLGMLTLAHRVGKACGGGSCRFTLPANDRSPVVLEIDTDENLATAAGPAAWVVVVMPLRLGEVEEGAAAVTPYRLEAERVLAEQKAKGAAAT